MKFIIFILYYSNEIYKNNYENKYRVYNGVCEAAVEAPEIGLDRCPLI